MGETIGRWLGRFNRIQWKLTLSYTVVTSAAVLIVALVPLLVRSDQLPRLMGLDARQAHAAELRGWDVLNSGDLAADLRAVADQSA